MALTVDVLKTFMHSTLLENFPNVVTTVDGVEVISNNPTLESAVMVANQNYNALTSNISSKVVVRFDSLSYQIKIALTHIYSFVLQDKAILHALSLSSMSLSEDEIFLHYQSLRNAEIDETNDMRSELLAEIKDKEKDSDNCGVMLYHRYGCKSSGRRLP